MIAQNQHRPRILVVDDELDNCRNLSDILTEMGYLVDTAQSGRTALEMVRRQPYDIALLDLRMPGMDGLTLYREIRKLRAGTVAMIVTAHATTESAREALDAGAWQVLSKPVDLAKLQPLLAEASQQPLVMVVDDDREMCNSLWDLLRGEGYRVCVAGNENEAVERLQGRDFQVVLVDLKLPGGDGRSVLKHVRELSPDARTLLITGFRDEMARMVDEAVRDGVDGVCYKPFDMPRLLKTLERLAHGSESKA